MGPQKKKDLMSTAFEGFWQSDLTIPGPKINTPRLRSHEDNAFDSLWGRGTYAPQPKMMQPVPRPQVVRAPQEVAPQQMAPTERLTQAQRYQLLKHRMNLQQKIYADRAASTQRANKAVAGAIKGAVKGAVNASHLVAKKVSPVVMEKIKSTGAYQKAYVSHEKEKIWNQYKKEKREEVSAKEIAEYKNKFYPKKEEKK
jgi:hypothetical protein